MLSSIFTTALVVTEPFDSITSTNGAFSWSTWMFEGFKVLFELFLEQSQTMNMNLGHQHSSSSFRHH